MAERITDEMVEAFLDATRMSWRGQDDEAYWRDQVRGGLTAAISQEPGVADGWQTLPRFKRGDRVLARTHRGKVGEGRVCSVETHYGWQGHKPYHCYAVLFDGLERQQHLSDEHMLAAAPLSSEEKR